eukprot:TRINITY_DN19538_c0_g1_i1.p2 TRINITY_DN19538_c0_g1~~TRINITY_DN19538_c0_g1_i1.p2  ORF type:complete len:170 (-),score=64.05 TRINITY_DN19538_c0_g1_i1:117-626(-)
MAASGGGGGRLETAYESIMQLRMQHFVPLAAARHLSRTAPPSRAAAGAPASPTAATTPTAAAAPHLQVKTRRVARPPKKQRRPTPLVDQVVRLLPLGDADDEVEDPDDDYELEEEVLRNTAINALTKYENPTQQQIQEKMGELREHYRQAYAASQFYRNFEHILKALGK